MHTVAKAITIIFLLIAHPGWSQSQEESAAKTAEQAGKLREALNYYVTALQKVTESSADDQRLREAIIRVAQRMSPRPLIPEEARNRMIRGRAAFKLAKSPTDMKDAIDEFRRAVNSAPWLGEAYFNLALVYEKGENYLQAIRNYKFYLLAEPSQKESASVRDKVVELEYLQERTQKQELAKADQQQQSQRQQSLIDGLAGTWQIGWSQFQIAVNGDSIVIRRTGLWSATDKVWIPEKGIPPRWAPLAPTRFEGKIRGLAFSGVFVTDQRSAWRNGEVFTRPMSGTISPDGRRISLKYVNTFASGARGGIANWVDQDSTMELERN